MLYSPRFEPPPNRRAPAFAGGALSLTVAFAYATVKQGVAGASLPEPQKAGTSSCTDLASHQKAALPIAAPHCRHRGAQIDAGMFPQMKKLASSSTPALQQELHQLPSNFSCTRSSVLTASMKSLMCNIGFGSPSNTCTVMVGTKGTRLLIVQPPLAPTGTSLT